MKLFLTGGFLGSGKTTAIQRACMLLSGQGTRTGVITNDQGSRLVDSGFIRGFDLPVRDVMDGCFCCNYDQLESQIRSLQKTDRPEVIFAESVGSCTDLVATVVKPLLQFRPDLAVVVSVFTDACVLPVLLKGSRLFHESIHYIYRKQLEEADVLVVSKVDLLDEKQLQEVRKLVAEHYPDKMVRYQNSLESREVEQWLSTLNDFPTARARRSLDIDYTVYGTGEAKLAWLDEEVEIRSAGKDAAGCGRALAVLINEKMRARNLPVGHLKFLMNGGDRQTKISFTSDNLLAGRNTEDTVAAERVSLLINARVQTEPAILESIVAEAIEELNTRNGCEVIETSRSAFQPGYPVPTHRILT